MQSGNKIRKGIMISITAQLVSMFCSFVLQMVVPKFITEANYAYWQTFVLYVNYVGIFHFGLLDGLILRYSQFDYNQLDKPRIRSQFIILLCITSFFSLLSILISCITISAPMNIVFVFVGIGILSKNVFTYTSYTFQITNRISKYALLVIIQRLISVLFVIVLLIFGFADFYWICLAEILGDFASIIIGSVFNKGLYFGKIISFHETIQEFKLNIFSGFLLLVANWSLNLLVGSAKMIIEIAWDKIVFGKVAFAFSVSSLYLTFISAASIVLFPSIKRMETGELPGLYKRIRDMLSPVLFLSLLAFFPGCWILLKWIPKYSASLYYLGFLFPLIVYSSRINLLTNNYLKAYRREKRMLKINIVSIVFALCGYLVFGYIIKNMTFLIIWVVLSVMLCSLLSEYSVMKIINIHFFYDWITEIIMTFLFIGIAYKFSILVGFFIYLLVLIIYFAINYSKVKTIIRGIKRSMQ